MRAPRSTIGRGALAGALAATALVIWFLCIDLIRGVPLQTPAFLAEALLGMDGSGDWVAVYTIIHYLAFAVVGVVVAWVVERMEVVPRALFGIVVGFLLFDLMFYGSVVVAGVDVVDALGWPQVLVGNIIAGIVLLGSLGVMGAVAPLSLREILDQHQIIREGLVSGLIGALTVAIWFFVADGIAGRLLFTPAALGSAMLLGARSVDAVEVSVVTVLGYSVIHMVAFLLTGLIAAAIMAAAEEISEVVLLGGVLLFVTFEAFSIGVMAILAGWLVDTLSWWNIGVANLVAAVGMGTYLYRRHSDLMYDLGHRELEEDLVRDDDRVHAHAPTPRVPQGDH